MYEKQKQCDYQTVQTGRLGNGLTKKHRGHDLSSGPWVSSNCSRAVSGSDTLSDTRSDTCDNRKSCTDCGACSD